MIEILLFPFLAALPVYLAGRRDPSRDPRVTGGVLILLAVFPLLLLLPKLEILPAWPTSAGEPVVGQAAESSIPIWKYAAITLWSIGVCIMAVRLWLSVRMLSAWSRKATPVEVVEGVQILRLRGLRGPMAAGVFSKKIFVPDSWESWSADTRRIVLAHEMAHHRRRDPLWRWIAEITCLVHGGNPLVLWIARRLAVQCEYACDASVIASGVRAGDYARLLCDLASTAPRGPMLAMASQSSLESRVRHLIRPGARLSLAGFLTFALPTLALAGVLASVRSIPGDNSKSPHAIPPTGEITSFETNVSAPTAQEVETRLSANPFPEEN